MPTTAPTLAQRSYAKPTPSDPMHRREPEAIGIGLNESSVDPKSAETSSGRRKAGAKGCAEGNLIRDHPNSFAR